MALKPAQEKLLDISADNADDLEAEVENNQQKARDIMQSVLTNPATHDEALFEKLNIPVTLTIQDLFAIPVIERNKAWQDALSGLITAAKIVAFHETQGFRLLENSEKHMKKIQRAVNKLDKSDLKEAAKVGVRKERRLAAKERRNGRRAKKNG